MNRFTPAFLQKIDKDWLLNQPEIWATRIHYLLFWGTIYTLGVCLLAFLYPVSTHNVPQSEVYMLIAFVPAACIFLFWAYQLSLYKVSDQFGTIPRAFSVKELLIYAAGMGLLSIGAFVVGKTLDNKNTNLISNSALIEDFNNLNKGYIYFHNSDFNLLNSYLYGRTVKF